MTVQLPSPPGLLSRFSSHCFDDTLVIWIGPMTTIGILVGVPAEHFLTRVQHLAFGGVLLRVVSMTSYVGLRRIPAAGHREYPLLRAPRVWRLVLALVIDAAIVSGVVLDARRLSRTFSVCAIRPVSSISRFSPP